MSVEKYKHLNFLLIFRLTNPLSCAKMLFTKEQDCAGVVQW